jgi:hypothetical protein
MLINIECNQCIGVHTTPLNKPPAKLYWYSTHWILSRHAALTMGAISIGLNHETLGAKE